MRFATNPLPGMNPWLEAYWGDIHTSLTTYARDVVQRQLPGDLQARVEEYLSVFDPDESPAPGRHIAPDVHVIEQPSFATESTRAGVRGAGTMMADEPLLIRRRRDPQVLRFISIVDVKARRRVVTAIEFLSLANKVTNAGRRQYNAKQQQFLDAGVSLVEIDLLRGGHWVLAVAQDLYPEDLTDPYRVCVVRSGHSELSGVYQASFRSTLPQIRIPLRPTDDDVVLPLQEILDQAYVNGRYGNDLDYSAMPEPALEANDWQWIGDHLRERVAEA